MPGTLSANGTWGLRVLETGSLTPSSNQAIQSYIFFFDQLQLSRNGGINTTYELATEFTLNSVPAGNYYFQILQSPNFPSSVASLPRVTLDPKGTTKSFIQITQVNSAADGRVLDIAANMPYGTQGIKQIDFIIGLQKKFNLVIYPNKTVPNQFIIETFNDWYKKGQIKDFNQYINLDDKIEVIPANNLAVNKLNFGDTLDQDYISQQFSKEANREYGKQYYTDTTNFYSQGSFDVKTTFASDPLIRIAGTGLSGSSVTPQEITSFAGNVKLTSNPNPRYACSSPINEDMYTIDGTFAQGNILYYDRYAKFPVTGFRWFSTGPGTKIIEVNSITGEIETDSIFSC
jgi:hypothetical protein